MNHLFIFKTEFTDKYHDTLEPINVQTSVREHEDYNVCAKYEDEVKKAEVINVNCNVPVARYVIVQRKPYDKNEPCYKKKTFDKKKPCYKTYMMLICEVIVIGHRVACK